MNNTENTAPKGFLREALGWVLYILLIIGITYLIIHVHTPLEILM